MKLVKSFDQFVNESAVNEAQDKFNMKVEAATSSAGEVAKFRFVLREFDPQKPLAELLIGQAVTKPEFSKFSNDSSLIAFIKTEKKRDSGFLQPRDLLKAIIIFKKADGYDVTKGKPVATVGSFKIYDVETATAMKADDTTTKKEAEVLIKKVDPTIEPTEPKPTAPTKTDEYADIETVSPDAGIIAFLKSVLLEVGVPKFKVSNTRVKEVKATQKLVALLTRADKKTPTSAAQKIKASGGADGVFGKGTAAAFGLLVAADKSIDSTNDEMVTALSTWCTLNGMTAGGIKEIFDKTTVETETKGGKDDTDGKNYYFVNTSPK